MRARQGLDRGPRLSVRRRRLRSLRGAGRALVDERRHMARLDRSLRELRIARPMSPAALAHRLARDVRRNRVRDGIVYVQITRGVARARLSVSGRPIRGRRWSSPRAATISRGIEADWRPRASPSSPCRTSAGSRVDIKSVALLPNVLAEAGGARAGRARGLAGRRARPHHRRRLVECLDRQPRRQSRHPPARTRHPAGHHALGRDRRHQGARARRSRSAPSRSRRPTPRAKPS